MSVFSVPVTIGVDEVEIAKNIEANVEKQVISQIKKDVEGTMYGRYGSHLYAYDNETPIRSMIRGEVVRILEHDREKIIKLAAETLAEKLSRTKAVKEAAAETAKDVYKPACLKLRKKLKLGRCSL